MKNFLKIACLLLLVAELLFLEKLRIETPMLTQSRLKFDAAQTYAPPSPELHARARVYARPRAGGRDCDARAHPRGDAGAHAGADARTAQGVCALLHRRLHALVQPEL